MTVNFEEATESDFVGIIREAQVEAYKYYCDLNNLLIDLERAASEEECRNILVNWTPDYKYITFK